MTSAAAIAERMCSERPPCADCVAAAEAEHRRAAAKLEASHQARLDRAVTEYHRGVPEWRPPRSRP